MTYIIEGITDKDGITREDGRYPRRLGSTIELHFIESGFPCHLRYILDNEGNKKCGTLWTSIVESYERVEEDKLLIITTRNSIYYLKELDEQE